MLQRTAISHHQKHSVKKGLKLQENYNSITSKGVLQKKKVKKFFQVFFSYIMY